MEQVLWKDMILNNRELKGRHVLKFYIKKHQFNIFSYLLQQELCRRMPIEPIIKKER